VAEEDGEELHSFAVSVTGILRNRKSLEGEGNQVALKKLRKSSMRDSDAQAQFQDLSKLIGNVPFLIYVVVTLDESTHV
jgi:hypothetical protein